MTISVGDKLPDVKLMKAGESGPEAVQSGEYFAGKKVALFSVPGAFTPTCSAKHLPSYVQNAGELKAKGIDEIACTAVNDGFVMGAWGRADGSPDVTMLGDGNGELAKALCVHCGLRAEWTGDMATDTPCPHCHTSGGMRPDVVWFGEMPYHMNRIYDALSRCDLFISIGTSGNVYPAAGFVEEASLAGAHTVELNLEPSEGVSHFEEAIHGRAGEIVPAYVEKILKSA